MLDFIAIEHGIKGEDLLEEHPQLGNVPLPVTEVVDELPDGFVGRHFESIVEAVVRCDHPEVLVQGNQGFTHRVDDVLGELAGFIYIIIQKLNSE